VRVRLALSIAVVALVASCGGGGSPGSVVRAWSRALNAGDNEQAARLFARDAEVVQGSQVYRLHTHDDAVAFNAALPCSGRIVSLDVRHDVVTAIFVLGDRTTGPCDGPGQEATAAFRVEHGKIVLWHQLEGGGVPNTL
jgi:limonene-1,2-epoxide hydrolase